MKSTGREGTKEILALCVLRYLRVQALLLFPKLRRELGAEVLRLEHLANLDFGRRTRKGIGGALHPFDRLFLRLHLEQPEAGDELFRLAEGAIDDRPLVSREPDACALRTRLE